MTVAIIGTGNMGAGLARLLAGKGVKLSIGHRDPARAAALAREIGRGAEYGSVATAAKLADIVILAVPYASALSVLKDADDLSGKVVIDISNPITEDYRGLIIGHTSSAAEEIQKAVPRARVVKAFNTIFSALLPEEARGNAPALQVFIAGDDEDAKKAASDLASKGGFEPVDAGPLINARFIEPLGELNIHMGFFLGRGTSVAPIWIDAQVKARP
jgi:8-hydroxy-5-deazaflavin:NADPH oxidoreductase